MSAQGYSLEDLIRFGGDRANQDANAAELARLRRIEAAARAVIAEWYREDDWYRPAFEGLIADLDGALAPAEATQ